MKKICYVSTTSMTLDYFVLETAKYMHEVGGYDVTLICDHDPSFVQKLPDYIHYIPVTMERGISISAFTAIRDLYHIFRSQQFDLVQYSTPNASLYASIAAFLARVPVRLYAQWGIYYVGSTGLKRKIFKTIERMVCRLSTWIEPDSLSNLQFSTNEGLYSEDKASVVWNGSASGVDLERFDIQLKETWKQEIRSHYGIPQDQYVVGFLGRIKREKGVEELLHAMQEILENYPQVTLLMAGPLDEPEFERHPIYQWSLNQQSVVYTGIVSQPEKYYAAMDLFVLPSYREGFGSVVVEAEAMGLPVVVTRIPGPTDAMIDNETGLVVAKQDVQALYEAIESFVVDKDLSERFGEAAYEFARDHFEQEQLFQHILEDRRRLLDDRH